MVNKIGFSNFRRFAEFPEIDFGDVTILVGGNNSGKSTIVKALFLCIDNLRLMRINDRHQNEKKSSFPIPIPLSKPVFRFDGNEFHDVKIKEFSRAIHNQLVDGSLPTTITFKFALDQFRFVFVVSGNRDEHFTTGEVERITIEDTKQNMTYTYDYTNHMMYLDVVTTDLNERRQFLSKLYDDFSQAQEVYNKVSREGNLDDITNAASELDKLRKHVRSMINGVEEEFSDETILNILKIFVWEKENLPNHVSYKLPFGIHINDLNESVVLNIISTFIHFTQLKNIRPELNEDSPNYESVMEEYETREAIKQYKKNFEDTYSRLAILINNLNVEYISAHAANQNTLYNATNKNDYIAQVVDEFWREFINEDDDEFKFIQEWMREFEIGDDFEVKVLSPGEAYTVYIKEKNDAKVHLADKGMGSVQLMVLLLRIATIVKRYDLFNKNITWRDQSHYPVIVIEEPEQNLHPKMQSKLAELFYSLAKDWGCKFLIETHSEYLVRKSQVIVAEEGFADEENLKENNHFKVYYLPSDGLVPYEMKYRIDGKFSNEFGPGFFDTASDLAFELF